MNKSYITFTFTDSEIPRKKEVIFGGSKIIARLNEALKIPKVGSPSANKGPRICLNIEAKYPKMKVTGINKGKDISIFFGYRLNNKRPMIAAVQNK